MSGLINKLLNNYRGGKGTDLSPPGETKVPGGKVVVNNYEIIKTPEDAAKAVGIKKEVIPMKFCPNGHPIPEGKSKCLGKGCKYS